MDEAGMTTKFFYGWVIVICSSILLALGLGMYVSSNSLFVIPVSESLGFSRGQFTFYRTIVTLTGALLMPLYGRIIQKIGVKKVLLAGALMIGLVKIGFSFTSGLWHLFILSFVYGLFFNSLGFMSIGVLVNSWFNGKKGLAIGLAYAGSGLGGAILMPVLAYIIETAGWQWAYRFMGLFGILVMLPVIAIFVKNKPEDMGLKALESNESAKKTGPALVSNISFKEALGTSRFWLLFISFFLISFFAAPTNTHSAPYLSDLGYTTLFVSYVMALFMVFLTVGKIILGFAYDHFGTLAGNIILCIFVLGYPIFALLSYLPPVPWVFAVFLGMAHCGVSIPIPILISRHFGNRDFPAIFSFFGMISALAQAIAIPAMGAVYDLMGSYNPAWFVLIFISLIVTACLIIVELIVPRR